MLIPTHCLLYDTATGEVLWMFTNGDPHLRQDLLPPLVRNTDGSIQIRATPTCEMWDLTADYTYEDMQQLHAHHQTTRVRRDAQGKLTLVNLYTHDGEVVEHTHPVDALRQLRREVEAKAAAQKRATEQEEPDARHPRSRHARRARLSRGE